jgi:hypothetical protein
VIPLLLINDEIDQLYSRVTAAILLAEKAETTGSKIQAATAYLEVSFLEEEIAKLLPATDPEGEIARRGVITAATSAGQFVRAVEMANTYASDPYAGVALKNQLAALRDYAEREARSVLRGPVLVHPRAKFRLLTLVLRRYIRLIRMDQS